MNGRPAPSLCCANWSHPRPSRNWWPISTRCWIWKTRIAAGLVSVEDPDGPIRSPIILDLVVDLAAPVPRVAALRDISGLEVGVRLLQSRFTEFETPDSGDDPTGSAVEPLFDFPAPGEDDSIFFDSFETAFSRPDSGTDGLDPDGADPVEPTPDPDPAPGSPDRGPRGRWSPR